MGRAVLDELPVFTRAASISARRRAGIRVFAAAPELLKGMGFLATMGATVLVARDASAEEPAAPVRRHWGERVLDELFSPMNALCELLAPAFEVAIGALLAVLAMMVRAARQVVGKEEDGAVGQEADRLRVVDRALAHTCRAVRAHEMNAVMGIGRVVVVPERAPGFL
jgi:hypothetical protein